jgi:hypothetical protein
MWYRKTPIFFFWVSKVKKNLEKKLPLLWGYKYIVASRVTWNLHFVIIICLTFDWRKTNDVKFNPRKFPFFFFVKLLFFLNGSFIKQDFTSFFVYLPHYFGHLWKKWRIFFYRPSNESRPLVVVPSYDDFGFHLYSILASIFLFLSVRVCVCVCVCVKDKKKFKPRLSSPLCTM